MTLFFKDEKMENMKEFFDMQPIWFCEALISAYHRTGNSEKALEYSCRILEYLKRCSMIRMIFIAIVCVK